MSASATTQEIGSLVERTRSDLHELRCSSSCSHTTFETAISRFEAAVAAQALHAASAGIDKALRS